MVWLKWESTHLHHETTADSVEGVGHDTGSSSDSLSHSPLGEEVGGLLVLEQHSLGCVVQTKVGSAVHDDTLQPAISQFTSVGGATALPV